MPFLLIYLFFCFFARKNTNWRAHTNELSVYVKIEFYRFDSISCSVSDIAWRSYHSIHSSIHHFNPAVSKGRIVYLTSCTILLPWHQIPKGEQHSQNLKSRMNGWESWSPKWPVLICLRSGVACLWNTEQTYEIEVSRSKTTHWEVLTHELSIARWGIYNGKDSWTYVGEDHRQCLWRSCWGLLLLSCYSVCVL